VAQKGFAADAIALTADGQPLFTDGAEGGDGDDNGWTAQGFSRIGESFTKEYPQYYIAENRQYVSYDKTLEVGPYNFGFASARPNWVEHFPYQNGLVVWLWDTSQPDNNVGVHPGEGLILPVDAHAGPEKWADGTLMRNRIQAYDSPFSRYRTDGFTLHKDGTAAKITSKKGIPVFDDRRGTYWDASNPTAGVKVTDTNTQIKILKEARDGSMMIVRVGPSMR
jgi:immune inhibitor A